ncbi:MAG: zinc-dependent metalloprotease [Saprospiraceae bacterium]|nr:zinc-dependent metalloprotease [Saprospiraceae bacterium]
MKIYKWAWLLVFIIYLSNPADSFAQKRKKGKQSEKEKTEKPEGKKKPTPKKGAPKPYKDVITEKAITQKGLMITHKVDENYYFELPFGLLEKEIMVVSRISGYVKNLSFGGAGMKSRPQQVIRWQKVDNRILIRSVSYHSVADENEPIYKSLKNNNFEPIIHSFPVAAYNKDTSGNILSIVIRVNDFFTTDVALIGALSDNQRKRFAIGGVDSKRSLISGTKSFPSNTEVRHILTYRGKKLPDNFLTQTLSIEMNQSFILLPKTLMQSRVYDARVGYFSIQQTNYSSDKQKADQQRFITRWRLEPKDIEAYKRGELVEPQKQIVYYIDPGTPDKWRPYLKQGINDWQKAFEAAGFKNAIIAKDPPSKEEDPDWSPEDVRYSVIRYITTDIPNAQGPHVHDPRTGEILESDILWYHNVMNLLRNWYFVQTAAINPEAQKVNFKDEVMGELIRFVAAHEVGHTLGLPHNMGSSVAYPVDSLRSPYFTSTHGTAPSIMDYARFNYIAQPGDGVKDFGAKIGEYDVWSIIYGYKPIPEAKNTEDERTILNNWIKEKAGNPVYRFGAQQWRTIDPSSQTEDLGNDAVKASTFGIKNLKRIMPNLLKWSAEDGKDYSDLKELYSQVYRQLGRYMGHVTNNVGGVYKYSKTYDELGNVYSHVPREKQKKSLQFLNKELFQTPYWLIDPQILNKIESTGIVDRLLKFQKKTLYNLFDFQRLQRLIEAEATEGKMVYTLVELFTDVKESIWSEVKMVVPIDAYRRNLQRVYLDKMSALMNNPKDQSDVKAVTRSILKKLEKEIQDNLGKQKDSLSQVHLEDILIRIDNILNPKGK